MTPLYGAPSKKQQGLTLIGLLIGLLLSMMCILASLTLYKNLIFSAVDTKLDTLHDGQLATAMLTTQKEVMAAGFGIDGADADDVRVVSANAAGNNSTISLLWRYELGGTVYCRGLREKGETDGDVNYRVLETVSLNTGCTTLLNLSDTSLAWSSLSTLARWRVHGPLVAHITNNKTLFDFDVTQASCAPFGAVDPEDHLLLTISAPSSVKLHSGGVSADNAYSYCLANTYPAASP